MEYSINEEAEEVVGKRNIPKDGLWIPFDQPCELNYHCPICEYDHIYKNGNYDERLHWSEYNGFIWCSVCNLDIPSCFCVPNLNKLEKDKNKTFYEKDGLKDAIKIFLDIVKEIKESK